MTLLNGKRCVIVGGAGGIGRAAVECFLDQGARVVIADAELTSGARAARDLAQRGEVYSLHADATSSESVAHLFLQAVKLLGGLDVLYHVAWGSGRKLGDAALHDCTDEGWNATLQWNLTSVFLTNRAAIQHFRGLKQPGAILNLASVLAIAPVARHFETAAYAAAKAGVIGLSRQAAAQYATEKIRINVLAPGLIDTPMAARACGDPDIRAYLEKKQPLGPGPGLPADCAMAAAFLCSDAARLISGAVIPVDGGWCISEGAMI